MKNKISILFLTSLLAVILFSISTYMQKKIIDYEPMVKCLVVQETIEANQKLEEEMFKFMDVPISMTLGINVIDDYKKISTLYSTEKLYIGQLALLENFDTKENLSIYECESGKEKISIKIKDAENGVSYSLKEGSKVNVYATMRSDLSNLITNNLKYNIGNEYDGYTIINILNDIKIIGVFDENGIEFSKENNEQKIDTIMVAVNKDEAMQINLIREIASFNITESSNNGGEYESFFD